MSDSAVHRSIPLAPEILEQVLLGLDHRTLLCRAQRVSKQFHDVIASSPRIQSKLFFKPLPVSQSIDNSSETLQNPRQWKRTWRLQDLFQTSNETDSYEEEFKNRANMPRERRTSIGDDASGLPQPHVAPYSTIGPWNEYQTNDAFNRKGVSWRKMLVQQPAITSIGQVVIRRRLDGSIVTRVGKVDVPGGIRLGHVWDALRVSMEPLKTDMCLMRLVWWEPTLSSFEKALYPMAPDVTKLFEQGAQLVLAIGFSECAPGDRFYGKFADEYNVLCHCEEFEPLDFNIKETVCLPLRRRSIF